MSAEPNNDKIVWHYGINFVVGALLSVGVAGVNAGSYFAKLVGFLALCLASVNIFGGFMVTERMLAMYKKKG